MPDTLIPFYLQWHLTETCNLRCRHCYQQSTVAELSYVEICQAIDKIANAIQYWVTHYEIGVSPSLHFTGGEPLIRPDVFDLLQYAAHAGFSASLLSNGTLITSETAQRLKQTAVEDVQISLDGREGVHDSLRGKWSFKKALEGIANLVAVGIDTNINFTVSGLNYQEIDPLIDLVGTLGVSAVAFSRLVPCGRGEDLSNHLLNTEQLNVLSRKLLEKPRKDSVMLVSRDPIIGVANISDNDAIPLSSFPLGGCSAGIFGVTITADGTVMPCRRMNLPIGNIRTDDFRQLWAESPVLISLRNRESYHGRCRTCRQWAVCRGCRAIALADARSRGIEDFLGDDPQCSYYKSAKESIEEIAK